MIEQQPESVQLLYSQLLDELLRAAYSPRGITFVTRNVKGNDYHYMNYVIGSSRRSYYLGPDDNDLRARILAAEERWRREESSTLERARLVSMLRQGGCVILPAGHGRVLEALEQAGVFVVGGVLVGSHAFALMANALGVKWKQALLRTQDVDIAHDYDIHVTVPQLEIDVESALETADKGFFAVPSLNHKHPSTSFKVRGKELSVSLLTPMRGRPDPGPRRIPSLNAMAEPLRFLEYLLDDIQPAALPARNGVLVNIPSPARFALHKLVVSQRRPPAFHTKARKDIAQAQEVLRVLFDDRPGDIALALDAAHQMPPKFMVQLRQGVTQLDQETRELLESFLDRTE